MMGSKVNVESARDLENQCAGNQELANQIELPRGGVVILIDPRTDLMIQTNFHVDSSVSPNLLRVSQKLLQKLHFTGKNLVIEPKTPFSLTPSNIKLESVKVTPVQTSHELDLQIPTIPPKNKIETSAQLDVSLELTESLSIISNEPPTPETLSPNSQDSLDISKEQLCIPPIPKKREGGIKTSTKNPLISGEFQTYTPSVRKTEPSSPIARQLEEKIQHIEKIEVPAEKIDPSSIQFLNIPTGEIKPSEIKDVPFSLSSFKSASSESRSESPSSENPGDYSAQDFVTRLILKNSNRLTPSDTTLEDSLPRLPIDSSLSVPIHTPQARELPIAKINEQRPYTSFNTIMLVDISRSMMARDVKVQYLEASIEKLKDRYNALEVIEFLGHFKPNVFVPRRFAAAFAVILYVLEKINRGLDERISVIRYADEPQVLPWKNQGWIQANTNRPDEVLEIIKVVIRDIAYSYGQATNMGMAIRRAQDVIALFQKQMPFQPIILINLTDGSPTDEKAYLEQVGLLAQNPQITFHVVGLGNPDDVLMMNTVTSCHGKYIKPQDVSQLVSFYSEIARSSR